MAALKKIKKSRSKTSGKKIKKVLKKRKIKAVKKKTVAKKKSPLDLKRSKKNPIIEPESHKYWESKATFNPSAIFHDGKVHIIYRAIGDSDISVLGYVNSRDGYSFDKYSKELAYYNKGEQAVKKDFVFKINYASGNGWGGGCEDPRITLIGDKVYMIYTAFDGWGSLRLDLTSIKLDDFLNHVWKWKSPAHISPPGEIHKNWTLFPEKISGRFAILHSIVPEVGIAYFDNLDELDGESFIKSSFLGGGRKGEWDNRMRGVGPAPIKTKHGW